MLAREAMDSSFKTKLVQFIKTWALVDNIVTAIFFISAILFFIGFAIYTAAHNVKF